MTRTLVVPDIHQDLPWLGRVLAAEAGTFDRLVLLGDYFDAHKPISNAKQVARMLLGLEEHVGVPVTFLVGNHDYQYAMLDGVEHPPREAWAVPGGCSGYSKSHAVDIRRGLCGSGFWNRCVLATEAGGYLLSHAGVLPHLWPFIPAGFEDDEHESTRIELRRFLSDMEGAWQGRLAARDHPAYVIGAAAGGSSLRPGLLWARWDAEFADLLPLPQVFGHTSRREEGARQKGRSWCIDGAQTCYAVIEGGTVGAPGTVTIKTA